MLEVRKSRILGTIPLILIVVVWPFAHASAEPPTEWQGPVGWWSGDIGTTGGSAVQSGDTFEITGDGHDIGGTADGFYFMFKELKGRNGSITARVVSNGTGGDTWAKGGVMIRDDLSPGSAHAMTVITGGAGGGAAFQWRVRPDRISGSAHDPTPSVSPPYLVRIEKTGRDFSSYLSSDGRAWRQQGATKRIAINDPVYIGICVTSHNAGSLRTYTFDNISYTGLVTDNPFSLLVSQPLPADGSVCTNNWVSLSWMPGDLATLHNVYFGTDLDAVTQRETSVLIATTDVPFLSVGQPGSTLPNGLQMGATYYWCVDEVNDAEPDSPWLGEVWSFRIPAEPAVYLLITSEELAPAFQTLVDWRTAEALVGKLVTLEYIYSHYTGVDKQDQIRNCIKDHYENNGTVYVTLGGDDAVVPVRYCYVRGTYEMPTDLYYGGLDGTWDEDGDGIYGEAKEDNADLYPEVWVGRIPVRTAQQVTDYINKVIIYESRSPDGFSQTMLFAGAARGPKVSGTERPAGFFDHEPASTDEIGMVNFYRNEVQPYWQATPMHKLIDTRSSWDLTRCGDYDFTPGHLSERLNWGYHHVWIRAHGGSMRTEFERRGRRELFYSDDALALTNSERLSIIYGEGCNTGAFDIAEPSISEAFLRCPHGGAVVYIGCSRTNYGGHYDLFYREIFVNKRERIGEVFGHYKMAWAHQSEADRWTRWVQFGRNLQGDSALRILGVESVRDLHLSSPHGCEVIELGTDLTIRWNASGTDFSLDEKVKLEYSSDSGHTWHPIPGAESLPYNGRFFIWENCSLSSGSNYRVRVSSLADQTVYDMSVQDFTVGELVLLTVQTSPIENVVINISSDTTDDSGISTNFNITVLEGATVNVSAPEVAGESSEYAFVRWKDERGNTMATTPDYTFTLTQDKTIVAEYDGTPIEWQNIAGWWSGDIGTTGGSAIQSGDAFEITGDGHDIWGSSDGFHYMFKELTGDGSITARVISNGTGTNTWAKGGVMIRNKLSPDSAHVMTVITGGAGGGAAFHWRSDTSAATISAHDPTPSVSPPYWVRVERWGNEFSGYLSADGTNWRQQGVTQTIDMSDTVYIGLCVTSHEAGSIRTYTFDNVSYESLINDNLQNPVDSQPTPADGTVSTNN